MPNTSPISSIATLMQGIELSGIALGERATALSEIIEEVDDRLRKSPGKMEAAVNSDDGIELSFRRCGRDWALWLVIEDSETTEYGPDHCPQPVELVRSSVSRKAKAFSLLPSLLKKIGDLQTQQLTEINRAFECLDESGAK